MNRGKSLTLGLITIIIFISLYILFKSRSRTISGFTNAEDIEYKPGTYYYGDDILKFNNQPQTKEFWLVGNFPGYITIGNRNMLVEKQLYKYNPYGVNRSIINKIEKELANEKVADFVENTHCCDDISQKHMVYQINHSIFNDHMKNNFNQIKEDYFDD